MLYDLYGEKLGICIKHCSLGCNSCRIEAARIKRRGELYAQLSYLKKQVLSFNKSIVYIENELENIS